MLIRTHQLDDQQLNELDLLSADCKRIDGNIIAVYKHLLGKDRTIPCNLLYYQQNQLIGFLSTFFFYEDTCEIAMMVAPSHRRQGIASTMLREIAAIIKAQDVDMLAFSAPQGLNNQWLPVLGFQYLGSEYQMRRHQTKPLDITNKSLTVRLATPTDIPTLCAIDSVCFPQQRADMPARFNALLNDASYSIFIVNQDGVPVGKAHLSWQDVNVRLTDIAIIPRAQGRGFGSALIAHCINHSIVANKHDVILEVETTNQNALNLYTRLGFAISNAHDYWTIPANWLDRFSTPPLVLRNKTTG